MAPEQHLQVPPVAWGSTARPSLGGRWHRAREGNLVFVGVEIEEELLDLVDDLGTCCRCCSTSSITTTTGSLDSSVFRKTKKRVWGSGSF